MQYTITNWYSQATIWTGEAESLRQAVRAALDADADLRGANLRVFRDDVWSVLSASPAEAPALLLALREGRVDGSCYEGACACLVGTLANARHCSYEAIPGLEPDAGRPAEMWFTLIKPGDTPETSEPCKQAAAWVETWIETVRAAFGPAVTAGQE